MGFLFTANRRPRGHAVGREVEDVYVFVRLKEFASSPGPKRVEREEGTGFQVMVSNLE